MDSKAIISILFVMIFGISAFGESYAIRKRVNPNQQISTTKPTKRAISTQRATKSVNRTRIKTSTKSTNRIQAKAPARATKSTNLRANRANASRNLSSAIKSSTIAKGTSALSTTTITLSSIGGVALASGVGGGIYALVKKKNEATATNNEPISRFYAVNVGMVDSGFDSAQIPEPSKNFYNVGVTPAESDPGHGTNVARAIRHHNTASNLYMYSARCGERGICPTEDMFRAMYDRDVRVINGSWGRIEDKDATIISASHFDSYYTHPLYYGMAKEAATRRIFVFAAGNDESRHANMQGSLPLVATKVQTRYANIEHKAWENARRGWITVTATHYKGNILNTRYANWIGEEAQNWGIAVLPFEHKAGTSYSAPIVSAVAANVWNRFPWMNNHLVTQTILSTADKYTISPNSSEYNDSTGDKWYENQVTDGPNKKTGWGILNEKRALNGPARFDKRLLVSDDNNQVQVNFALQRYDDLRSLTFSNDIAGDAGLRKYGNGTLYMSGNNTYAGNTDIDDGTLVISNALLNSKITINKNGTLRTQNLPFVDSTQPSSVTLGQLNTGYALTNYGNFEVFKNTALQGDYISGNNATLSLDVDAKLSVSGSADMSGGKLAIHSLVAIPSTDFQTKTLLTAQQGINRWDKSWSVAKESSAFLKVSEVKLTTQNKDLLVTYKRDSTRGVLARSLSYIPQNLRNIAQGIDNALDSLAKNTTHLANNAESNAKSTRFAESSAESNEKNLVILSASEESQKNTQNRDSSLRASHSAQNDNLRDFAESNAQSAESSLPDSATLTNDAFYTEALSLLAITQQEATNAVASLSGEIYDSNLSITHKSAMLLNRTIARRLYQINDGAQSGVWADISYARSTMQSKDFATGKIVQYAIMAGIDGMKAEKNSAFGGGALFSVDRAKGDFGVVGNSDMISYALSLYGVVSYEKFYMLARIGAALHDTDVTRKLNFGQMQTLQNKQKDISYHGYIEVGYNLDAGWFRLTPFVAWEEDLITRKKVSESGKNGNNSNFSLVLDSAKYRVYSLIYGAKGHFKFGGFALEYSALDMFAPNPNKFRSNAKFSGGNNNFASSGIPQARNLVFLSLGASYAFSQLILRGEYSLSLNPDTSKMIEDEIINLNLRYNF